MEEGFQVGFSGLVLCCSATLSVRYERVRMDCNDPWCGPCRLFMEILLFIVWLLCGFGTMAVAQQRGGSGCGGLALGFLLGPLGLALAFLIFDGKQCPMCRQTIPADAQRCPKCQAQLTLPTKPDGRTGYRCPKCHTPVELNATKCTGCGVVFNAKPTTKKCPDCAEEVKVDARKCRFCGFVFTAEEQQNAASPADSAIRKTCSNCGVQTVGDAPQCARCGQPFPVS
jgi:predicted amidophosphoribosyltransferase